MRAYRFDNGVCEDGAYGDQLKGKLWVGRKFLKFCEKHPPKFEDDGLIHWLHIKKIKPRPDGRQFSVFWVVSDGMNRKFGEDVCRAVAVVVEIKDKSGLALFEENVTDGFIREDNGQALVIIPDGKYLKVDGYILQNVFGELTVQEESLDEGEIESSEVAA